MNQYDALLDSLRSRLPEYMAQKRMVVGESGRKKIRCINPSHHDAVPSMSYHPASRKLHCFGCGVSYDIFDVIAMDYPECDSFPRQVRRACELFGMEFPEDFGHEEAAAKPVLRISSRPKARGLRESAAASGEAGLCYTEILTPEPETRNDFTEMVEQGFRENGAGGAYFASRGISRDICERFRLYEQDGRAMLPVFSRGKCRCYCSRAIREEAGPRHKNSAGPMELFNGDYLRGEGKGGVLFLTEAVFDALSCEECGFQAVALCGAGNVRRLLEACAENPKAANAYRFIAAGDADEAGRRMNAALKEGLGALGLCCGELIPPEGCKDLNEALTRDPGGLRAALEAAASADAAAYGERCAAAGLPALLAPGLRGGGEKPVPTGFSCLDRHLDGGLYPGLYIFGAVSSLGKTSFLLQIADEIARRGEDVLFFSLEMDKYELMAKSLSRLTWTLDETGGRTGAFTAREILRMEPTHTPARDRLLERAVKEYEGFGRQIFLREGVADLGVADIRQAVREHIGYRKKKPVVFVDYLQILRPADLRSTDKQNTDRAVVELKRISRDFDLPVLAISSFNRENYRNPVSMEAFKESGAVEYSTDVLFGLQFAGTGEANFSIDSARLREPRAVELVLLKNRCGLPYAKMGFSYFAKYSAFVEKRGLWRRQEGKGAGFSSFPED